MHIEVRQIRMPDGDKASELTFESPEDVHVADVALDEIRSDGNTEIVPSRRVRAVHLRETSVDFRSRRNTKRLGYFVR
jgi:hypothetical protein